MKNIFDISDTIVEKIAIIQIFHNDFFLGGGMLIEPFIIFFIECFCQGDITKVVKPVWAGTGDNVLRK